MKYLKHITLSIAFALTSFSAIATPGLGVITITTDDPLSLIHI